MHSEFAVGTIMTPLSLFAVEPDMPLHAHPIVIDPGSVSRASIGNPNGDQAENIPLESLGFSGPLQAHRSSRRHYFLSLMHWFEAERFRLNEPALAEECMNCHSLRMLNKLSARHQARGRDDWAMVRMRVLLCGMTYAMWADPHPLRWKDRQVVQGLIQLGFPERFAASAFDEFLKMQANPQIVFFGVDQAPPEVIGRRLTLIHRKFERQWSCALWIGRHANWRINDWMREQHIPVLPVGQPGDRLTLEKSIELTEGRHSVVFDQKAAKKMDPLIRQLRLMRRSLDVDPYAITGAGTTLGLALD